MRSYDFLDSNEPRKKASYFPFSICLVVYRDPYNGLSNIIPI